MTRKTHGDPMSAILKGYDEMVEMLHGLAVMAGMEPDENGDLLRSDYFHYVETALVEYHEMKANRKQT